MLNQVNLNTNNAFTAEMQNTTQKPSQDSHKSNLLSIADSDYDTFESPQKISTTQKNYKKTTPIWLKAIYTTFITTAAILGVGFLTTKFGYTPLKTNTKGLFNSRTTKFENGAKDVIGGIKSVMTMNSHCGKKSLEKLPSSHQELIVIMDKKDEKGIKTFAQSKFKDNIIYGGELKLSQLKDYDKIKEYVKKLAAKIKSQKSHENITFASENSRIANVLNSVLIEHADGKKASTYNFVEGGVPSHYFWGKNGLDSDKLDEAIWEGWCQGMEIKSSSAAPKEATKEQKTETRKEAPVSIKSPEETINNNPTTPKEKEKVPTCWDKTKEVGKDCLSFIKNKYNSFVDWLKKFNKSKK